MKNRHGVRVLQPKPAESRQVSEAGVAAGEFADKRDNLKRGPDVRVADIGKVTQDELGIDRRRISEGRKLRDQAAPRRPRWLGRDDYRALLRFRETL